MSCTTWPGKMVSTVLLTTQGSGTSRRSKGKQCLVPLPPLLGKQKLVQKLPIIRMVLEGGSDHTPSE